MIFGDRVRQSRDGRSMYLVAAHADTSVGYWSDIERSRRLPSVEMAKRMCEAVGGDWRDWARDLAEARLGPELWDSVRAKG